MTGRVLLYGATGFSGTLIAARLVASGVDFTLAGRNAALLAALGERLGRPWRAFGLHDPAAIDAGLAGMAVVVNAAGPFVHTAGPMMAACLRVGADYLDITGEWPVFAEAMALSEAAAAAGVMLMPGAGVCIVATEGLLALAAARHPDTVAVQLAASRHSRLVRGSVRTIVAMNDEHVRARRGGQIVCSPSGHRVREFDFGAGPVDAVAVTWPEVITGEFSTGIANIETYAEAARPAQLLVRAGGLLAPHLKGPAAGWPAALAELWPATGEEDVAGLDTGFVLVAHCHDRWRRVTRLRLRVDDGHDVTAVTTDAIVRAVLAGNRAPGFSTPTRRFGGDFILKLGCAEVLKEQP
ncbi:saccharopine dehydrogenase NADP-binding domain-containing protein [Polymorphobacter fuscus]|uniref:Saccharopine dehydrogenase n=1 Tax=Sandarakinorhabdus fusca TaxID=1439888 RepID=A0A7C9KJF0_9SPHN|nr:saccharopine dehydrogenase NADP-binding domain-containing protein [Polymorphobacter fuscus]KAB7645571.1 saccharopine dehydrogenase [Polymorphobacter fuscus]MQT18019.1 saccharopine dehydrogenase [Polymorphobacter fuscus]NJC08651.1 short subunit dehydrogenase-like uncharacterized protein [Polymorphobacter fuscus]